MGVLWFDGEILVILGRANYALITLSSKWWKNSMLYLQYKELSKNEPNVIFGGRLGEYKYYDMDKVVEVALNLAKTELA